MKQGHRWCHQPADVLDRTDGAPLPALVTTLRTPHRSLGRMYTIRKPDKTSSDELDSEVTREHSSIAKNAQSFMGDLRRAVSTPTLHHDSCGHTALVPGMPTVHALRYHPAFHATLLRGTMSNGLWKPIALALSLAVLPVVARGQAMQSVCKDGSKSVVAGKGTCSAHGGVDDAATKVLAASGKMVACTDGTMSAGGRGACSGHGGIGKGTANAKREMKAEKKEMKAAKMEMKADKKEAKQEAKADKKEAMAMAKEEKRPPKATGKCKDGTYTEAKTRQGACTGHGGVTSWY